VWGEEGNPAEIDRLRDRKRQRNAQNGRRSGGEKLEWMKREWVKKTVKRDWK
jgi:hypothetical protein